MKERATCDIEVPIYIKGKDDSTTLQIRVNLSSVRVKFAVPPTHEIFNRIMYSLTNRFPDIPWERALSDKREHIKYTVEYGEKERLILEYASDLNFFPTLQFTLPHTGLPWMKRWGMLRQSILFRKDMESLADYILKHSINKDVPDNTPPNKRLADFMLHKPLSFDMSDVESEMYEYVQQLLTLFPKVSSHLYMHNTNARQIRNIHLNDLCEMINIYDSMTGENQRIRAASEIVRILKIVISKLEQSLEEIQGETFEHIKQKADRIDWMLSGPMGDLSQ